MDLILAIVGVIFIIKGDVKVADNKSFSKKDGRIFGLFLLLPIAFFSVVQEFTYDGVVVYGIVLIVAIVFLKRLKSIENMPKESSVQ